MADKEIKEVKDTDKAAIDQNTKQLVVAKKSTPKWVLWIVLGVVGLYLLMMALGFWVFHAFGNTNTQTIGGPNEGQSSQQRMRFSNERDFTVRESESDGLTTTTTKTTYTQTQGVVSSVNGDTIVVAGGGKTQSIKTNGHTKYTEDVKPAVNDTVVIVGTKDGDTITATQVAVYN